MAYPALAVLMLISAPSDVPDEDLSTVKKTLSQWNLAMGRASSVAVLPVSWSEHAVAEFGERPQAILNEQIVDDADMALALFADRLGTPTGQAESGTLEEIERLVEAGKPVCVLVNRGPRALAGEAAIAERQRLEAALVALYQRAIVLPYSNQAELVGHVNNMLSRATGKVEGSATLSSPTAVEAAGVWPTVERTNYQETDSKGRLRTKTNHYLVLHNATGRPVFDVSYAFPESDSFDDGAEDDVIDSMGPDQASRFPLHLFMGSERKALCVVKWRFEQGDLRESSATIMV